MHSVLISSKIISTLLETYYPLVGLIKTVKKIFSPRRPKTLNGLLIFKSEHVSINLKGRELIYLSPLDVLYVSSWMDCFMKLEITPDSRKILSKRIL